MIPLKRFDAGWTPTCARAGHDEFTAVGNLATHHPLMPARAPTDEPSRSLALLCLEICRDPQGASVEAVAGSWWALAWAITARKPSIWAELAEAGFFQVAGARLSESSAVEMVNWRCAEGLEAGGVVGTVAFICQLEVPGVNQTQLVVENGIADSIASVLKVREKPSLLLRKPDSGRSWIR